MECPRESQLYRSGTGLTFSLSAEHSTIFPEKISAYSVGMFKRFLALFLFLTALSLQAQTPAPASLAFSVKWSDGVKCACTLTIIQKGVAGAADTTVFSGATGPSGGLTASLPLNPQLVYFANVHSNEYGADIYAFYFVTGFLTPQPLTSLNFKLMFTRPQGTIPAGLAPGTSLSVGI